MKSLRSDPVRNTYLPAAYTYSIYIYLQHIIAFGRLVNLRVKLLFRSGVAVGALVAAVAVGRFAPLVAVFDVGAGRRPVLERLGTPAAVLVVVVLRAGVALTTKTRRTATLIRLVIGQNERRALPFRVFGQTPAEEKGDEEEKEDDEEEKEDKEDEVEETHARAKETPKTKKCELEPRSNKTISIPSYNRESIPAIETKLNSRPPPHTCNTHITPIPSSGAIRDSRG